MIERPEAPFVGDERATLVGFLDFHRSTLALKCAGLTPEQLAMRVAPPSTLSLLGLVRHLADVERAWFDRIAGRVRTPHYFSDADPDGEFDKAVGSQAAVDDAFATWSAAIEDARVVATEAALDATFEHPRQGTTSVRWVLAHLVEEYARHNGHADLLREAIDGTTGE